VPIFEPIMQAVWAHAAARTALAPPSPEAKRQLSCRSIDLESGEAQQQPQQQQFGWPQQPQPAARPFTECFRIDRTGRVLDTQYQLVSRESAYIYRDPRYDVAPNPFPFFAPFQSQQPGHYDPRRNNGYYQDGQGRYIQAPRDSGRYQYGQPQYGRDPRAQPQPGRDVYGREVRPQQPQPQRQFEPGNIWGHRPY
jgi:penicillin-binding protein 1A